MLPSLGVPEGYEEGPVSVCRSPVWLFRGVDRLLGS